MRLNYFMILSFMFLCSNSFAQGRIHLPDKQGSWVFDKTVSNVDMYHMIDECNGKNVIYLKFENKNKFKVQINWKEVFVTSQVAAKTESFDGEKKLLLPAGQVMTTYCGETINQACLILAEKAIPHYKADFRNFEFKDVLITALK